MTGDDESTGARGFKLKVTRHAVTRFRERIRDAGGYDATRKELVHCLQAMTLKHSKEAHRKKSAHIPLGCCVLVCERGAIVTVVPRKSIKCALCAEIMDQCELADHMLEKHASKLGPLEPELNQPRGLSAADEPCSEGVNNTIAESADNKRG